MCMSCSLIFQRQVANSKQFPFRFFTAYEVLSSLEKEYEETRKFMSQTNSYKYVYMSQSDSKEYITIKRMCMYHNHYNEYKKQSHEIFHCQIHKYLVHVCHKHTTLYMSQSDWNYTTVRLIRICHSQTNEYMSQLNWRVFATIRFTNICQLCVQLDFYTLKS